MGKISPYAMRKHKFGERSRASSPHGQGLGDGHEGVGEGLAQGIVEGQGLGLASGLGLGPAPGQGLGLASAPGQGLGRRAPPVLGSLFKSSGGWGGLVDLWWLFGWLVVG